MVPLPLCALALQHVHLCLLKQPSSAKKSPAAVATVDIAHTAGRASGSTHRPSVGGYAMQENGTAFPTPPHDSPLSDQRLSATSGENGPGSSARGRRVPDPVGSPRPTRVSLQGVFSPKVSIINSYAPLLLFFIEKRKARMPKHYFVVVVSMMSV